MVKTKIIAEIGVNHNGQLNLALEMIEAAAQSGADIVKFQTYSSENLVLKNISKTKYQKKNSNLLETQYSMLKRLELSKKYYDDIIKTCKKNKVEFLSSAFDIKSLKFLLDLNIKRVKIPSGEITNLPYLEFINKLNLPIILSTGMSNLREITNAIKILTKNSRNIKKITLLHCNSEYPTPMHDVNLLTMPELGRIFKTNFGYSDHTLGIEVPIAATALGASLIEKHFTLNRKLKGPDQQVSLTPKEFKEMVSKIRNIEKSLGSTNKKVTKSEYKNIKYVRKSIVANQDIKKGELFTYNKLIIKRPGTGISPMYWHKLLGKKAKRNFKKNELIKL